MKVYNILVIALGALSIGHLNGIGGLGVRASDVEENGVVSKGDGGAVRDVGINGTGFNLVKKFVSGVFGRHSEDDYDGGNVVVVTTHEPIVYITVSSCSSSTITVSLGTSSDVVIHGPSSTGIAVVHTSSKVEYTGVPSTDVTVVTPTTSATVDIHITPGTVLPSVYIPMDSLSTVTAKSTQVINTCPAGGCIVSIPVPAYSVPNVPGSTVTSIPPVITRTSTTTTSDAPTSYAFSTGFSQVVPTTTAAQGEGVVVVVVGHWGSCLPILIACALGSLVYII